MLLVVMILSYRLVMELLRSQERDNWLKANNEILNAYAHGLKQQIERTAKAQETLSILRHDIRHRANLVQYYLSEGNLDAVSEMFAQVNEKLDETIERRYCADAALNWVLSSSAQKAADRQIRFECSADIPPLNETMELEFGTVVLNLLENALSAAAELPAAEQRFVEFSVHPVKGQAFLRMENSYCGTLAFSPVTNLPLSGKGEGHGYGLRSVLAFARMHQATFSCTAEGGVFHTRLLIPLPKES
jgi:sensor histidine kinase regulating citrate/malate metabolism